MKNLTNQKEYSGYVDLYHEIKATLSLQNPVLFGITIWFAPGYLLINFALISILTYMTLQDPLSAIGNGIYWLVSVIFAVLIFTAFISLAFIGSRDSKQYVKKLVTQFAFYYTSPYRDNYGLNQSDINIIKNIAEAEQSASDWRGTYVSIMVIGAIGFLWGAISSSSSWFLRNILDGFTVQLLFNIIEANPSTILIMLGWIIVCVIGNLLGFRLVNYLHDFLESEYSNRAIIYACIETIELFQSQNIKKGEILNVEQKQSVASLLGYAILLSNEKGIVSSKNIVGSFAQDGDHWILVKKDYKQENIVVAEKKKTDSRRKNKLTIFSIFSWLMNGFKSISAKIRRK